MTDGREREGSINSDHGFSKYLLLLLLVLPPPFTLLKGRGNLEACLASTDSESKPPS